MIRWEPVKGESQGFAVFDHGRSRERRILFSSKEDFDYITRWGERCGDKGETRGRFEMANLCSKHAYGKAGIKRGER